MKINTVPFLLCVLLSATALSADDSQIVKPKKLWSNMCESCHNGKTAPDASWMREKYKTTDDFAEAVRGKGDRCMNILKNDPGLARTIALELGIEDKHPE